MRKITSVLVVLVLALAVLVSCSKKDNKITVAASATPHALMLELVKDDLKAQGYELEVKVFEDYVLPNQVVESGEMDANFFQHIPYMDLFNETEGTHLVNVAGVHIEPYALYSKKYTKLNQIPDGATIAVTNDPSNEGRALLLLQSAGLIKVDPAAGTTATVLDITSNPHKLDFIEMEAASLPVTLTDVDAAVINGNYALEAGLSATRDGLFVENADSPYVNILAVKKGNENEPKIQALVKAVLSDEVRNWVKETYPNGDVVTVF